jgi:hypothetical protein
MRSHRLALATLLIAGTALSAGCGSGRDTEAFLTPGAGDAPAAVVPAPEPAPVVIAGPDQEVLDERDAAKASAAANLTAAEQAEKKRKAARRELREEREKAERARKRAAARETTLREALADAAERRRVAAQAESATPKPQADAPISGSSVEGATLQADRDRRSTAEARAAVIRLHELLDARDARACDVITPKLLSATYGAQDGALERCRAAIASITSDVRVVIARTEAHGKRATVGMVTRMFDTDVFQTMHLVLVDGTWMVDRIERQPSR